MGEVLHYTHEDWLTMKMLKGAIKFMQSKNSNGEYSLSMKMERDLLSSMIRKVA